MILHKDSHTDHGLTEAQINYLVRHFAGRDAFFIETIGLPAELGTVPSALYGPSVGDFPVPEHRVVYQTRGDRRSESRMINLPMRETDLVTVVAGPHDGEPCVLFTAYGGAPAAKEPWDFERDPRGDVLEELRMRHHESVAFWAEHALSLESL